MKVILFACVEKNIGDDLFIYSICNRYQNIDFYITEMADYGDLKKLKNLHFSKAIKLWSLLQNNSSKRKFKELIKKILTTMLELIIGKDNIVVYIVGNAFKNMNYDNHLHQTKWLKARINLSKEFYLLSTNFGPYNDERWKRDCDIEFRKMKDICFRDEYSYNLFNNLKNVRYAPDAVLSLPVTIDSKNRENKVIISMIDCSMKIRGKTLNKITKNYEKKLSDIASHYSQLGFEVILLTSNNEQDYPAAKRIFELNKNKTNISIFEYNGNFLDVLSLYKSSRYVISTRLHTMILAWIYKIPVLPLVYDIKIKNMLSSYGFNEKYVEISDIESLDVTEIDKYFKNYSFNNVNNIIFESYDQFKKLDMKFMDGK